MSEPVTDPAATEQPAATEDTQGDPADLGEGGKKALTAERAARKAAEQKVAAYEAQLAEAEKAKLSDLERAQATAKEYETAAAKATAEALRWRVAAAHGISAEDAETFLTGSDEATITRQAERLAQFTASPSAPRADLTQSTARPAGGVAGPQEDFARFLSGQMGR